MIEAAAVLEEEEHQDRHQNQVDHDVHQHWQAGQGEGQRPLTELAKLAARRLDQSQHLLFGDHLGVALRQHQQHRLPLAEHSRQLIEEGEQLFPDQRHQHQQEHRQQPEEQRIDQPHSEQVRHPEALQHAHQPLDQERDHDCRQHRRKHAAEGQHDGKTEHQDDRQHHRFLIGEVALHPVLQNLEHQGT
ncbi:hypothetical protein D3C76_1041410 [compost metagenome]